MLHMRGAEGQADFDKIKHNRSRGRIFFLSFPNMTVDKWDTATTLLKSKDCSVTKRLDTGRDRT